MDNQQFRYNNFHNFLRKKFSGKVYKVSLDAGFSCPNREHGMPCTYCDEAGSGTGASKKGVSIREQMLLGMREYRKRYKAEKFIAYFQSYSNTNLPVWELKNIYDQALGFEDIVGLSIGTRPDCVDEEKIRLISNYCSDYYVWIEYGLQSANNETLKRINRGHTFEQLAQAVEMTKNKGINICLHVIIGLPGETYDDVMRTADEVAKLGIDGIKIHLLHIIKNTPLEKDYLSGKIKVLDQQTYVSMVCDFLEKIPKNILVQRLTGERRKDILTAPDWCLNKAVVIRSINDELIRRGSHQGIKYNF
ncbi:TIGR01212 family radical SAM protein [bacterium]|nr:TIGR01212 family radical SAM protein [bacterium]